MLPAALAVTGVWAVVLLRRATDWNTWLWPTVAVVMVLAIVGLFVFRSGNRGRLLAVVRDRGDRRGPRGPDRVRGRRRRESARLGRRHGRHQPDRRSDHGRRLRRRWRRRGGGAAPGGAQQGAQAGGFAGGAQAGGEMPGGGTGEPPQGGGQQGGGTGESPAAPGRRPTGTPPGGTTGTARAAPPVRRGGAGGFGGGGGRAGDATDTELVTYLEKHQDGATWLLAVSSSQSAGQLIVSTGKPVISMWGWSGTDKAMTLAKLKELVKKRRVALHPARRRRWHGRQQQRSATEVTAWVEKNGTAVKESEYSDASSDVLRLRFRRPSSSDSRTPDHPVALPPRPVRRQLGETLRQLG